MERGREGWLDGWIDGQREGGMERWMDGQRERNGWMGGQTVG